MRVLVRCYQRVGTLIRWGGRKSIRLDRNDDFGGMGTSPADLRMYTLPRHIRQRDDLRSF